MQACEAERVGGGIFFSSAEGLVSIDFYKSNILLGRCYCFYLMICNYGSTSLIK